jgi:hypothetical protein
MSEAQDRELERLALRNEGDFPWCRIRDCLHRASRTLSARCPIHDPEPYARAWRRAHEAAVDEDRRRMQAIRWLTKGRAA